MLNKDLNVERQPSIRQILFRYQATKSLKIGCVLKMEGRVEISLWIPQCLPIQHTPTWHFPTGQSPTLTYIYWDIQLLRPLPIVTNTYHDIKLLFPGSVPLCKWDNNLCVWVTHHSTPLSDSEHTTLLGLILHTHQYTV